MWLRGWATWRTKLNEALDCRFLGNAAGSLISALEGIGLAPEIKHERSDGDLLRPCYFQQAEQIPVAKVKLLLAEHYFCAGSAKPLAKKAKELAS